MGEMQPASIKTQSSLDTSTVQAFQVLHMTSSEATSFSGSLASPAASEVEFTKLKIKPSWLFFLEARGVFG